MKKKITNTLILLGIVGAIGSGAAFTSAYLINGDKAVNTMDATEVNVHIEEDFTTPSDPKPGDQISKKPRVVNDSNVNC